jgi:hypothetical protein
MLAAPLLSVVAEEEYVPLVSVTEPVGVAWPELPLTVTATVRSCAVVMVAAPGVTVTVGVTSVGGGCWLLPPPPHPAVQAQANTSKKAAKRLNEHMICILYQHRDTNLPQERYVERARY